MTETGTRPEGAAGTGGLGRPALWGAGGLGLCLAAAGFGLAQPDMSYIAARFFLSQDLAGLMLLALSAALFALVCRIATRKAVGAGAGGEAALSPLRVALVGGLGAAVAFAGWQLVFAAYPLSADEFWAMQGGGLWQGRAFAPVAPGWQGYATAMTPSYVVTDARGALWGSMYLPVNAALQALLPAGVTSAMLGGASVGLLWAVARRIMPGRPAFAALAVALLACSPQWIVTAMTPYAMTAHLALNLLWLLLVLRGGRADHLLAGGGAVLATGLHQAVFFPLFATPVIWMLWQRGARRAALWQAGVLGAALALWANWLPLALGPVDQTTGWSRGPLDMALHLADRVSPAAIGLMAMNLIRLVTWTHPLLALLVLAGGAAAWRAGGVMRALAGGVILTLAVVAVVSPHQGHGWGYRYLHGTLGNLCLIGAFGFLRLCDGASPARQGGLRAGFAATSAFALLALLPLRLWQAQGFAAPYAAADAAMTASNADIVIVTDGAHAFTGDLVRNAPDLSNRPLRLQLAELSAEQLATLCKRGRVVAFDAASAEAFGIAPAGARPAPHALPPGCGTTRLRP